MKQITNQTIKYMGGDYVCLRLCLLFPLSLHIPGMPKMYTHFTLLLFEVELNYAICSRTFAQKMDFMRQAGQLKKLAEARLWFEVRKTFTILIQFFLS
jgi:hypothetical protein